MSGGHFAYQQSNIGDIADSIQEVIDQNGLKRPKERAVIEPWEDEYYYNFPPEIIEKFKEAVSALKIAQVYAQRADWLLSGDDGQETFLKRLREDLNKCDKQFVRALKLNDITDNI